MQASRSPLDSSLRPEAGALRAGIWAAADQSARSRQALGVSPVQRRNARTRLRASPAKSLPAKDQPAAGVTASQRTNWRLVPELTPTQSVSVARGPLSGGTFVAVDVSGDSRRDLIGYLPSSGPVAQWAASTPASGGRFGVPPRRRVGAPSPSAPCMRGRSASPLRVPRDRMPRDVGAGAEPRPEDHRSVRSASTLPSSSRRA
jgi:hypothetical protein